MKFTNLFFVLLCLVTTPTIAQWGNCGPMLNSPTLCAGSSTSISGVPISGALSYQWIVYGAVSGTYLSSYITSTPNNTLYTSPSQTPNLTWDVRAFNGTNGNGVQIGACGGAVVVSSSTPNTPRNIVWTGDLCLNQAKTYTSQDVGASSYSWEVVQIGFSANTTTNQLYLSGSSFNQTGSYTLRVKANNPCGSSSWREVTINVISGSGCIGY